MSTALHLSKPFLQYSDQGIHSHPFYHLSTYSYGFSRNKLSFNFHNRVFQQSKSTGIPDAHTETNERLPRIPNTPPVFQFNDLDNDSKKTRLNDLNSHTESEIQDGAKLLTQEPLNTTQKGSDDVNSESFSNNIEFRNELDNKADEIASTSSSEGGLSKESAMGGSLLVIFGILVLAGGLGYFGFSFKDQINEFLLSFESRIDEFGAFGYPLFVLGYAGLEILAVPAIPITMSAGLLFGPAIGTILCSVAGTLAAVVSFLIARYVARDRILKLIQGNKKFAAIDRAIGKDSFLIVTMLRLSPLLPFSVGNYIYGLTSVELLPYTLGSWLGMLPGTWAYVSAGAFGRSLLQTDEGSLVSGDMQIWFLALGIIFTVGTGAYVTNVAKKAMKELDES